MRNVLKTTALIGCLTFIGMQIVVPALADSFHSPSGDINAIMGYISGTGVAQGNIDLYTNSGRLLVANGTVGSPAISFGADDDGSGTGFYRAGADSLGIAANGGTSARFAATAIYLDDNTILASNKYIGTSGPGSGGIFGATGVQTNPIIQIRTGSLSNGVMIGEYADRTVDYGLSVFNHPTVAIASKDSTDTTQVGGVVWDRIALGGPDGAVGCINQSWVYTDMTDTGFNAGLLNLDEQIPDGSVVFISALMNLVGFTGDVSAVIQVGTAVDADRYNTGTPNVFVTNQSGVALGAISGTAWHDAATTVVITITTNADFTNVSAGSATVLICFTRTGLD